jgi:hypothetical protein
MKKVLHWITFIWQLPQHLVALIIVFLYKGRISSITPIKTSNLYQLKGIRWGVSFGQYIFLPVNPNDNSLLHEYGHSIQSKIFGPLYLLIIGLPSITMNILSTVLYFMGNKQFYSNYYNRWPESWADHLGGVNRM